MSGAAKQLAEELLKVSGITAVISVDDWYAKPVGVEDALGLVKMLDDDVVREIVSADPLSLDFVDKEIAMSEIKKQWDGFDVGIQLKLYSTLTDAHGAQDSTAIAFANDLRTGSALPELFGEFNLQMLSLAQWKQQKDNIIGANMPCTLLLIDENFGDEHPDPHEGLNIIDNLLKTEPDQQIVCALLSNNYHMPNIHGDWKALSDARGFDRSRFVLIPKDSVTSDHHKFLALIKLAVFNGRAKKIKQRVNALYADAVAVARAKVEDIDIYEFEQIVCSSSSKEGVWEPETLIRVLSLFHKQETRSKARLDAELHKLSNELRAVSELALTDWGFPTPSAIEIQRLEYYENAAEVNSQLMPTELGDIFQIDGQDTKRYILVAQPCDLMVRAKGKRNDHTSYAMMLELTPSEGKKLSSNTYSLEFYGEDTADWHVNLKAAHYTDLNVLDLCALNEDGLGQIILNGPCSDRLTPVWRRRDAILRKAAKSIIDKYAVLVRAKVNEKDAQKMSTTIWLGKLFEGKVDGTTNSLTYNFRRVGRLRQPRAGALLSKYAASVAREAFEHPFAVRSTDEPLDGIAAAEQKISVEDQPAAVQDVETKSSIGTAE